MRHCGLGRLKKWPFDFDAGKTQLDLLDQSNTGGVGVKMDEVEFIF